MNACSHPLVRPPVRRLARVATTLAIALTAGACATSPGSSPGPSPLDPAVVLPTSAARLSATEIDAALDAAWADLTRRASDHDPVAAVRVAAVLARLVAAAPVAGRASAATQVDARILDDTALDAWCLSLGRCAITRGMLELVGDDDAVLAALLAHEIAHGLLGHPGERLALARQTPAVAVLLGQPHHQVHEHEAMGLSLELLARAGFEPRAAILLWSALAPAPGEPPAALGARARAPASGGPAGYARRHPQAVGWAETLLRQARRFPSHALESPSTTRGIIEGSAKP